jgi:hypothetical protein
MQKPGFILVLTVGLMTVMTIIVARMLMDLTSFQRLEAILLDREQAKHVALSGIQLAMAQLLASAPPAEEKRSEQEEKFQKSVFELQKIMQHANRWQKIALTEQNEGISGSCTFYIACERGKINPFVWATQAQKAAKQQPFVALDTQKKSLEHMIQIALERQLADRLGSTSVLKRLMELLEKRQEPWDDISELLEDESLKKLGKVLFLTPTRNWALTDCFSLEHNSFVLQPWALSKSVAILADLTLSNTPPTDDDIKKIGDTVKQARPAKETWDLVLQTLYHSLPPQEWYGLLSTRFEADIFSVISYGTYRDIIVKLYAIVQRKHEKGPEGSERSFCIIKKLYWIYD